MGGEGRERVREEESKWVVCEGGRERVRGRGFVRVRGFVGLRHQVTLIV